MFCVRCTHAGVEYRELLQFCEISHHSGDKRTRNFVRSMNKLCQYRYEVWGEMRQGAPGRPAMCGHVSAEAES